MRQLFDRLTYFTPDGVEYSLAPPVWTLQEDGYGMSPIEYVTQRGPFQHGETVLAAWLRPRTIDVIVRIQGCTRIEYWNIRRTLIDMFRPNRTPTLQPGILRKYMANGLVREWFVFPGGGLSFPSHDPNQWDEYSIRDLIRFTCYDPVARDPVPKSVVFTLGGGSAQFPLQFPFTITGGGSGDTKTVVSNGTWDTFPSISIIGPASSVIITNLTTNEHIALSYNIPASHTVAMNLAYGAKSIMLDDTTNLVGFITPDSDIGTFHLRPGSNSVQVIASGTTAATQTALTWFDKDIGV